MHTGRRLGQEAERIVRKAGAPQGQHPRTLKQTPVVRPREERRSEVLAGRLSFKAISNAYVLGEQD